MDSPGQSAQYCTYTFMENAQNTVFSDNGQENDRKKECHPWKSMFSKGSAVSFWKRNTCGGSGYRCTYADRSTNE